MFQGMTEQKSQAQEETREQLYVLGKAGSEEQDPLREPVMLSISYRLGSHVSAEREKQELLQSQHVLKTQKLEPGW